MARIEEIDRRLWLWAEALKAGDGSGYPTMNTLHQDWSPPAPGQTPTMKVSSAGRAAAEMTRAVRGLSQTLQATVVAHYLVRMSASDIGLALGCKPDTVLARIEAAHRQLAAALDVPPGEFCNIQ